MLFRIVGVVKHAIIKASAIGLGAFYFFESLGGIVSIRLSKRTPRVRINKTQTFDNGDIICYGKGQMGAPSGGFHCRSIEFRTPAFDFDPSDHSTWPTVVASVYSPDSVGTIFAIYSVKVNS